MQYDPEIMQYFQGTEMHNYSLNLHNIFHRMRDFLVANELSACF